MAPLSFPEEVDVFTIPHSRMKELVNKYLEMLTETNFDDAFRMTSLLENLSTTFKEFKAHEQIENRCIMRKLKEKLRALSITNTAVCNCHKDNQLTEMMSLFRDGYRCTGKTAADRVNYGLKLRQALEQFTEQFIPHMKEEEEVFQPLLMKYFTYEELRELKTLVLEEHWRTLAEEGEAKLVEDSLTSESSCDEGECTDKGGYSVFDLLPDELLLSIFADMNPQELGKCSGVNQRWRQLTADPKLWTNFYPVQWAKGLWTFHPDLDTEDEAVTEKECSSAGLDEDADIDESADSDNNETEDATLKQQKDEVKLLSSMTKYLLPRVGQGVKTINMANSLGITNGTLYKILLHCPNVEVLQLAQTRISDIAFKGLGRGGCGSKLRHVDLAGCEKVTDLTLRRLTHALHHSKTLNKNSAANSNPVHCTTSRSASKGQSVLLEKKRKTLKNEKCSRTSKVCDFNTVQSGLRSEQCQIVRTKSADSLHDSGPSVQACSGFLPGVNQLTLPFSEMTLCSCPLARQLLSQGQAWNSNIEDCLWLNATQSGVQQWSASACDIREVTQLNNCDSLSDSVDSSESGLKESETLLQHLSLSGCWQITDSGLRHLAESGGLPSLQLLDLSGCLNITASGLETLVEACPKLDHANLFYCDNLEDDPYPVTASGCQNLACGSRVCCRKGT